MIVVVVVVVVFVVVVVVVNKQTNKHTNKDMNCCFVALVTSKSYQRGGEPWASAPPSATQRYPVEPTRDPDHLRGQN